MDHLINQNLSAAELEPKNIIKQRSEGGGSQGISRYIY